VVSTCQRSVVIGDLLSRWLDGSGRRRAGKFSD
jgi:hypothetical protein